MDIIQAIATQFSLHRWQVENTVKLLDDGNTVPFIARYRKEAHGTLDDQIIRQISERVEYLRNLEKRREEVRTAIEGQKKMTEEISAALDKAATLAEIEDIYRPFRPKRRTRASIAKEMGLEPLADAIFAQAPDSPAPIEMAADFVNEELGVNTAEDALKGAMDIIAENISDNADIRKKLRNSLTNIGIVKVTATDPDADSPYTKYYDYSEPLKRMAAHRVLAINRGEREKFLKVDLFLDPARSTKILTDSTLSSNGSLCTETVREAGIDAYTRLIFPSVEREMRTMMTDAACESSIKVFSLNLRQLLLQSPLKGKTVIGLDPGYRTGCKVAVVDPTGKVLDTGVIYVTHSAAQRDQAKQLLKMLVKKHSAQVFSIGNGTASKETEIFTAELIKELGLPLSYMVVSEAGASVYSASKLAAEEFPQYDVSLRSAVSIARRLQDPLAELVKIDPKSIGVGQYQHDMPQKELGESLDGVVEDAVSSVGVDLNTASPSLLARISGINSGIAKNIVVFREENGAFTDRKQLKKVPKLGAKAFEQCAGFLRIAESDNVLDNTAVHPESYAAAEGLLKLCGFTKQDVKNGLISKLPEKVEELGTEETAEKLGIGVPTLLDIIKELLRPGRDPRDELPPPLLRSDIMDTKDLKPGMELKGTVRNITDFGAFVDIGVHQDGLVHKSKLCSHPVRHPSEIVSVGDVITVWILDVDYAKEKISLTMIPPKAE